MFVIFIVVYGLIYRSKQVDAEMEWSRPTTFVLLREHRFDSLGVRG